MVVVGVRRAVVGKSRRAQGFFELAAIGHHARSSVAKRTTALGGFPRHAERRRMNHSGQAIRSPVERNGDGEEEVTVREVRRPVDRVHVPNQFAGAGLGAFLAHDSMRWELAPEPLSDQSFASEVVLGQQIEAPLLRDFSSGAPTLHGDRPRVERRALCDLESMLAFVFGAHEVLHFRGFPGRRHTSPPIGTVFAGVSTPKPVKGGSLRSLRFRRRPM